MPITFPKQYMSISELVAIGFTCQTTLHKWVHIKGFPATRTGFGRTSSWIIDTNQMIKWQKEKGLLQ